MPLLVVHRKVVEVQNLHTKKSNMKTKEILNKSFKKIIKNGLVTCLDYLLLDMTKFTNT